MAERNRSSQMIYQAAPPRRPHVTTTSKAWSARDEPARVLPDLPAGQEPGARQDLEPPGARAGQAARPGSRGLSSRRLEEAGARSVRHRAWPRTCRPRRCSSLSELKTLYPGVDLITRGAPLLPFRALSPATCSAIMGKMDPREWRERKARATASDSRIGKMGLENVVRGRAARPRRAASSMEVDAQGPPQAYAPETRSRGRPGSNIYLTIDAAVQKAADEGLRRRRDTGRGRGRDCHRPAGQRRDSGDELLSHDFDPNVLLSSDPEAVKRGTRMSCPSSTTRSPAPIPPGSDVQADRGPRRASTRAASTPRDTRLLPRLFQAGFEVFSMCDDHEGPWTASRFCHGLSPSPATSISTTDRPQDRRRLASRSTRALFGLGQKTNIALRGEKSGHLFGPETRALAGRSWYDGDTVNLSIGQGELTRLRRRSRWPSSPWRRSPTAGRCGARTTHAEASVSIPRRRAPRFRPEARAGLGRGPDREKSGVGSRSERDGAHGLLGHRLSRPRSPAIIVAEKQDRHGAKSLTARTTPGSSPTPPARARRRPSAVAVLVEKRRPRRPSRSPRRSPAKMILASFGMPRSRRSPRQTRARPKRRRCRAAATGAALTRVGLPAEACDEPL